MKDSARLSLRGVHGVATGVDFKWLVLLQDGAGAELRLGVTRVSSSEGCRMRQVVKVKVELVCDMHFPGWCAHRPRFEGTKGGVPWNGYSNFLLKSLFLSEPDLEGFQLERRTLHLITA